ncbi:hypothetical protein AB0D83_40705 [Streptomyces decoyicus]
MSYAQFEFVLGLRGLGPVNILSAVPDAAAVLMALTETAQAPAS